MALKKMIDADKICADQLFPRESASLFSSLPVSDRRVACSTIHQLNVASTVRRK